MWTRCGAHLNTLCFVTPGAADIECWNNLGGHAAVCMLKLFGNAEEIAVRTCILHVVVELVAGRMLCWLDVTICRSTAKCLGFLQR